MHPGKKLILLLCSFLSLETVLATALRPVSDSLKLVLAHTSDPQERVNLLLDLKDLNENTNLNLPYSIRLFREAATIGDTYAMSIATIPILNQYSSHPEKEDSLHYYIRKLRELTPGTRQEGMDAYSELHIAYRRMYHAYDKKSRSALARQVVEWCDNDKNPENNIYQKTKQLTARGIAGTYLHSKEEVSKHYIPQTGLWEEAFALTLQMPNIEVRRCFQSIIYSHLSFAYLQMKDYPRLHAFTRAFISYQDEYIDSEQVRSRQRYLYSKNITPYLRMIRCAANTERPDSARTHFAEFRARMLRKSDENLTQSLSYIYEIGYMWKYFESDYATSLQYCDSLTRLIERGLGHFYMMPDKISQIYIDRSHLLMRLHRFNDAYNSYEQTYQVLDSLDIVERTERTEALLHRNEMDKLRLTETRATIRNHITVLVSMLILAILLLGTGIYFYRAMRRNRILQADIMRHSRKALESDRMKSNFVNSLCGRVRPPFNAIDRAAHRLMMMDIPEQERAGYLETIRQNTAQLLSTLDNMLEAANLDSLTDKLHFVPTDIDILCREEIARMSLQRPNARIEYNVESIGQPRVVQTHARYFRFVIRALLDNAGRFTREGKITLRYEFDPSGNPLRVSVTDTGCGISTEQGREIFSTESQGPAASHGLSLALCKQIAIRLKGSLRFDHTHSPGARFIFIICVHP